MASSKSIGRRFLLGLPVLTVVIASAVWWQYDDAGCAHQDEYTLHGTCLDAIHQRAEHGEASAQWTYGNYLSAQQRAPEANEWYRRAATQARRGIDLWDMPAHCANKVEGFEPERIEAIMLRVAQTSPDAHLKLMALYLDADCGAFNLDKAAAQIAQLTQCGHLQIGRFLSLAQAHRYPVAPKPISSAQANLELCRQELARPPTNHRLVVEVVAPDASRLDALTQQINTLVPEPADARAARTF